MMPVEWWFDGDSRAVEKLVEMIHGRRMKIRELITEFRKSSRQPFPNWKTSVSVPVADTARRDGATELRFYFSQCISDIMNQLTLWNEVDAGLSEEQRPTARGSMCRKAAQAMQKSIDERHEKANRALSKPPTRKRIAEADTHRKVAIRLEQMQATLLALADQHDIGSIDPSLAGLISMRAIERALFTQSVNSPVRKLFDSMLQPRHKQEQLKHRIREVMLMRIPGFFPTPESLAQQLAEMAELASGQTVLEPSAGTGSLIDAARNHCKGLQVGFCELNLVLLDILQAKYEGETDVHFLTRDSLELEAYRPGERYDRILMNPPFERSQDIEHVRFAHTLLKPKGLLIAVMSSGAFARSDRKATEFQKFLKAQKAVVKEIPEGAFKASGTLVASKIVALRA